MRRLFFALAYFLTISAAAAQARPSTLDMTCRQAEALVASRGAIVLSTGPYTYDRYVVDGRFCMLGEFLRAQWVPTRDTPQCPIGYVCTSNPPLFWDDD